jgi:CheY-like chemotaxis protein
MATILKMLDKNQPTQGTEAENPLLGKRVVIVDDNPRQRSMLRAMYESLGLLCVGEASNGLECLQVVARASPHVVSLDVVMPVMHGLETLAYLRDDGFSGIVVFVTEISKSHSLAELKIKGYQPDAVFSRSDSHVEFSSVLREVVSYEELRVTESSQQLDDTGS